MASAKLFSSSTSQDSDLKPSSSNTINLESNATDLTLSISGIFTAPHRKTVDEVWGEIVAKKELKVEPRDDDNNELMTLEDYLAKVDEERECVKVERLWSDGAVYGYGSGGGGGGVEEGGRRGKRRVESLDKVVMQRQRRMIKNRESAARSRERKQAYQVELESMVMKLEEENELLMKEKDARIKERLKVLMEKIVPVVEKRKPQSALRRVHSGQW